VARDERVLDEVGMVDEARGVVGQAQADHVAVAARAVLEETQQVAAELGEVPDQEVPGRPRSRAAPRALRGGRGLRARPGAQGVPQPRVAVAAPSCSRANARSTAASSSRTLPSAAPGAFWGSNSYPEITRRKTSLSARAPRRGCRAASAAMRRAACSLTSRRS